MAKKQLNQSAMDELMGGLVPSSTPNETAKVTEQAEPAVTTAPSPKRGRKKNLTKERICTIVDCELMDKVRTIAEREGLGVSLVVNAGLAMVVKNYEDKHGVVKIRIAKKGDVNSVFDI